MRNRRTFIAVGFGLGLGISGFVGCTTEPRDFGNGDRRDGGEEATDNDRDSSVPTETTDNTTAMSSEGTRSEETDVISVTLDAGNSSPTWGQSTGVVSETENTGELTSGEATYSGTGGTEVEAGTSCSPVASSEANCGGDGDDDCDGLYDCDDVEDCSSAPECQVCVPVAEDEPACNDGRDDDCDGFEDCDDPDCAGAGNCQGSCEPATEDCTDGDDNDCDGFTDCADSACAATAACCSTSEAEQCGDGIDNNCDGVIDCPIIVETMPPLPASGREDWEGGAVSADKAGLRLEAPAADRFIVQCRSGKPANVSSKQFVVCNPSNPSGLNVKPFPELEGPNPLHNGLTTTQVRFAYPNGQVSQPASFTYYTHNSLYGVEQCPEKKTDAEYFAAASASLLTSADPTFAQEDAGLAPPFVNITFNPAASTVSEVAGGEGAVEYHSLRRRFALNAEKNLILMKRVYSSRQAQDEAHRCAAATIRKHVSDLAGYAAENNRYFRNACDALVMNRDGAGVCLVVNESSEIVIANPQSSQWQYWNFSQYLWVNWAQADNFLWRKLRADGSGSVQVFSPKCYDGGSACTGGNTNVLFLPDRELFAW